jgi:hypothetical protein
VGVGEDQVRDGQGGDPAEDREHGPGVRLGGPRIDRHNAVVSQHEGEVGKVVPLGDIDLGCQLDEPGRAEAKALLDRDPVIDREQGERGIKGGVAGALERRFRFAPSPEGRIRLSEGTVDIPAKPDRNALLVLEHPFEVGHRRVGLRKVSGELREDGPPEVAGEIGRLAHGPVELRERLVHPGFALQEWHLTGQPSLEEPLQREPERLIGLARSALLKKRIPLIVTPTSHELSDQREDRLRGRIRPANRFLEGFELDVAADGELAGMNQAESRPKPSDREKRHELPYGLCACHDGLLWCDS